MIGCDNQLENHGHTVGDGFNKHVFAEHNMWNYLYLRLCLDNKMKVKTSENIPGVDFTGQELSEDPCQLNLDGLSIRVRER